MNELEEGIGKKIVADALISTGNIYSGTLLSLSVLIRDSVVVAMGWAAIAYSQDFDDIWGFTFGVINVSVALLLCGAALKTCSPLLDSKKTGMLEVAALKLAFSGVFGGSFLTAYLETKRFFNTVLWPILIILMITIAFNDYGRDDGFSRLSHKESSSMLALTMAIGVPLALVGVIRTSIRKYLIEDMAVDAAKLKSMPYISTAFLTLSLVLSPLLITIPLSLFLMIKTIKDMAQSSSNT